ncbi:inositol monophosphatase family protein [Patescibacteria group bacterium]
MLDLKKVKKFSEQLAFKVGNYLVTSQNKVKIKAYKDRQDIVTNVDLEAEKRIIKAISKNYPQHNIQSEEIGFIDNKSLYTWVIDPLDGTKEYARGLATFNLNISLETAAKTILGLVYVPKTKEMFSAIDKFQAWENNMKINVSQTKKLKDSFIYCHLPSYKMEKKKAKLTWQKLAKISKKCYRLRSFQADVLSACWVAKGAVDGYILFSQMEKWWDIAAGILIVQEAGGMVTTLTGKPFKKSLLKKGMLVTNGKIHQQLLNLIN